MKSRKIFILSIMIIVSVTLFGQTGKALRGVVVDMASGESLPSVTITLLNSAQSQGVISDENGNFAIEGLKIGRYDVQASYIGYEPMIFREVVVSTSKEAFITISLRENINKLQEVVVTPQVNKQEPFNNIALASARMLSVDEASRYAGGYDDPARLVSAFAGVAGNVSSNAISIRGNSPQFLQWRLEGVEIPNPTHFPDITGVGGGILTALSSQMLANSDFLTGAFPAQYNNALSGVFDMNLRNGNRWSHEHTAQIGTMGLEFSSEGPFKKGGQASYLFNYRYATMALAGDIFGDMLGDAAGMRYQDLSFKLNFPSKKAGTLSVWGIGVIDRFKNKEEEDISKWETADDNTSATFKQTMGAGGIGHKYFFNNDTYIKSALAVTYSENGIFADSYDTNKVPTKIADMQGSNWNVSFNSYVNKKFSARHSNRTGINISNLHYDMDYSISPSFPTTNQPIENFAKDNGSTYLASAFTNSTFRLSNNVTTNIGVSGQYFFLNKNWTIEPRASIQWQMLPKHSLALAYGKHSRHEKLDYYFVTTPQTGDKLVNKKLDFAKAHHIVLSYDWSVSDNVHIKVEPYFQYLYDVPVEDGTSYSIINQKDWYLNKALVNEGKGRNYGVEVTLERYLADGYYYLLTGSVFDSRYKGGDGVWRDTRLNRGFMFNALGGKEWKVGRRKLNTLGVNLRFSYQGGDRYSPIDEAASQIEQDAVFDTSRAYEKQLNPAFISSVTTNYRINKKNLSHEFAFKLINATGHKEYEDHLYNYKKQEVEMLKSSVVMPNISYKVEF
ncbi:TonB-dependent receptor [Prevotella sp. 10(H)]|uniref:TonB-dependent receptor n=1 Tax=Prevotella sp. 10(H) TaxID=1158294 RepID=UPI0004A747F6|nr:TonB-dependent receptor [Prevotella sp. 10(H)]